MATLPICSTCLETMRNISGIWECPEHGRNKPHPTIEREEPRYGVREEPELKDHPEIKAQTDLATGKLASKPTGGLAKARANADMFAPQVPKRATESNTLGPVGKIIGTVVSLSIAAPFIIILWKWALALGF